MRPEWHQLFIASLALAIGALGAGLYARSAVPYYDVVARLLARGHPWQVANIQVKPGSVGPGSVIRLTGFVLSREKAARPEAAITADLQVAAVVEAPVIFWTLLLLWPTVSRGQRVGFFVLGIPIFMGLEAATTTCQLLSPLATASAILAGEHNPLTSWDRWSRFIEGGGRIALAIGAAILTVTLVAWAHRHAITRKRASDRAP
jgi:hypothetical protein